MYQNHSNKPSVHNPGFTYGFLGAVVMIIVHLILLLFSKGDNRFDFIAWVFQLIIYYIMGYSAAEKKYQLQKDSINPLAGVQSAGSGAAIVISILVWIYIIIRGLVRDAMGIFVIVEPISFCFLIFFDIFIAAGLGTWAGKAVCKKYKGFQIIDY